MNFLRNWVKRQSIKWLNEDSSPEERSDAGLESECSHSELHSE